MFITAIRVGFSQTCSIFSDIKWHSTIQTYIIGYFFNSIFFIGEVERSIWKNMGTNVLKDCEKQSEH